MSDFDLKKFSSALKGYVPDDIKLEKEGVKLLHSILCKINTNFVNAIVSNAEKLQEINAKTTQKAIQTLIPKNLKRHAFANAGRDICLYSSGVLAYKEKRVRIKHVTVDFKNPIKRILQDFNSTAARGFLPQINGHLNDLCYALAKKSSENAQKNNGALTENDILFAINEMLPHDLRQHAFARIAHLQKHSILPPTQTSTGSELPVAEDQLMEHAAETDQTQERSSWSLLNIAKQMFSSTEEQHEKVNEDEANKGQTRRSLMDIAWGWLAPSPTVQTEAEETEQAGSENNESLETAEK